MEPFSRDPRPRCLRWCREAVDPASLVGSEDASGGPVTTVLVSTIGGHLAQLHALVPRLSDVDPSDVRWVTHDSPQSRSLLSDADVEFVPYIDERDIKGVVRAMPSAVRALAGRSVDRVVSTGSAIAGAWLPAGVGLRKESVFIESAAKVTDHTRTGRMLQCVPGVRLLTQSDQTAGGRWTYCGSVFDGFEARSDVPTSEPARVVVSLGTSPTFGFDRLLDRLEAIIPADVEVLWQTGCTDLSGRRLNATPWLPEAELAAAMAAADVVVCHAGAGSALGAILCGRRPVLVARRAAHGEFRDDHQLQIAQSLAARDLAVDLTVESLTWQSLCDAARWSVTPATELTPIAL